MDANGSTQKKKVTMAEFFDYPEYAYNEKGQLKNWVAGPNPWVPAATVGLLSLLGGIEEAEGGGYGLNLDSIVDAGLLGTKTYLEGTQNLQNQRKDYYDHNLRSQQQMRENLKFQHETEDREKSKQARQRMINNFPAVLESIFNTGRPEFRQTIPMLQNMFAADPNKAVSAAMEIISQIEPGEIKLHDVPGTDGKYITQGKKFVGQFKGGSSSKTKTTLVGNKALERIQQDNPEFNVQGTDVNNLAVKLNADGSIESHSFVEPNEKLTVTEQTQFSNLADKYNATPQYRKIAEGVSSLLSLKKLGTENPNGRMGFNDVATIFAFMKSLDPTSVVRESEYATAANAGVGVPEKIWKAYNRALNGEILLPQLRREIIRAARDSLLAKEPNLKRIRDSYITRGVKIYKFDKSSLESVLDNPFDTIRDMELPESDAATAELIGSVLDDNSDDDMMEESD